MQNSDPGPPAKMDPEQFAADLPYMVSWREGEALTQLDPSRQYRMFRQV